MNERAHTVTHFCRDCRWAKPWGFWPFRDWTLGKCHNPRALTLDLHVGNYYTTGKVEPPYCSVERGSERAGACGQAGWHWEPRS